MSNISLTALAREELEGAKRAASGRSSRTVHGGHERLMRQTLIALVSGHALGEHSNPGEATVQVLQGRVRLVAGDDDWVGAAGHFIVVPDAPHSLEAIEDSVVLLSAVSRPTD